MAKIKETPTTLGKVVKCRLNQNAVISKTLKPIFNLTSVETKKFLNIKFQRTNTLSLNDSRLKTDDLYGLRQRCIKKRHNSVVEITS